MSDAFNQTQIDEACGEISILYQRAKGLAGSEDKDGLAEVYLQLFATNLASKRISDQLGEIRRMIDRGNETIEEAWL